MNPSAPLNIDAAQAEYKRLKAKLARKEKLDALEKDDFKVLKRYVRDYHIKYLQFDAERIRDYEDWRDYLHDQRTFEGTLLNSEIFATLEVVSVERITRKEFLRRVKRIKRIDAIFVELCKTKEKPKKEQSDNFDTGE